ncbi:treslin-like [Branchiostoma lanceolatum]|uniref:treslin-like n=1 Tax=Branchiostoma lanceolatum TaxID=7740 RepID=UPI00345713BF
MSQEGGSFRVVFLVDISPGKDGAAEEEKVSNALNLSALKILSHFAHKNGQTKDNILWGYKFFNSSEERAPRDRFNFREFDSKLFEAFETEVTGRLEPPWSGKENELFLSQQVADQIGVDLLSQVLEGLNGCVIPGNALLQLGSHVTSSIQSLHPISKKSSTTGEDAAAVDVPDFPLTSSSLLEYYTARSWERHGMDGQISAVLCNGGDREAFCSFELQPMFSPQNRIPAAHSILSQGPSKADHSVQALSIEWNGSSSSQQLTCSTTLHVGSSQGQRASQGQRSSVRGQSAGCRADLMLMVRGTVERGCLPLACFHPTHAFTCVVHKESLRTSAEAGGCRVTLEALLLVLSREGLSLVVDFHDPSAHLPVTGVLQPLTAASATLTVVRSDMLLTLEKVLAFPKVSGKSSSNSERVDSFVKRCVSHFLKENGEGESNDQSVAVATTSSSSSALFDPGSARFRLKTLEPWYKSAPNSGTSATFIQQLSSIPEDIPDEGTQEPQLLELLHKLYTNQLIGGTKPQQKVKDVNSKEDRPPDPSSVVSRRSKRLLARIPSFSDSLSARAKQIVGLSYKKHEEQKTKPKEEETTESQLDKEKQRIMEERKEVMKNVTIPTDFTDEDSLISQLKENYNQWLEEDKPLLQFVQSSVQVALHYVKSQGTDDPETYTRQLLEDKFLSKAKVVRDKYKNASGQSEVQMKIRE